MGRKKLKWKLPLFLYLLVLNTVIKSLPVIEKTQNLPSLSTTETLLVVNNEFAPALIPRSYIPHPVVSNESVNVANNFNETSNRNITKDNSIILRNQIRPEQTVTQYSVEITLNGDTFSGRAVIRVELTTATREDSIIFHAEDLNIQAVSYGILSLNNPISIGFSVDDGLLDIPPPTLSLSYVLLVEYTGNIRNDGSGIYRGTYDSNSYIAMNLYPTYARRVFPCMDEPTLESTVTFTFNNVDYSHVIGNTMSEVANGAVAFAALQGPPHRWGMIAHNFVNINNPVVGVRLYAKSGTIGQDAQSSVIINAVFTRMEEWTNKPFNEFHVDQKESLDIIAMPDIVKDWHTASTVCVWEPYILIPTNHAATQRKTAMVEISSAIANQWFGYVIYPANWRYQWINTALSTHSAFETLRAFQTNAQESDNTIIDINTIFVTEFIQEALFRDSFTNSLPLETAGDIFNEDQIREHINGLIKYKAPAIIWMLKNILGPSDGDSSVDYIEAAARTILNNRGLQTYTSNNFYDAINNEWLSASNRLIDDIDEYLEPWVKSSNYPVINVQSWSAGVTLTQERFSFTNTNQMIYSIPLTYTTSVNPNFDDITPQFMLDSTQLVNVFLDEEDWFLCNIQGQGYYRVNYDENLWERIISALQDPDTRNVIHPLNRATLVDDALNLARAGRLNYDIALRIVLTMEHETEYAVWRAFVRNMEFLRTRLVALVNDDEDRDPDIYVRMIRRTINAVESELSFYPEVLAAEGAMTSMTRAIVMEHACKARYDPCIAAAIDWFYDPDDGSAVNPNIPHDIRPAVYCTMMREGNSDDRDMLLTKLNDETNHYERLVIVRALGCVNDDNFILSELADGATGNGRFGVEERVEFFKAVMESSLNNANLALRFIRLNTAAVRNNFGGPERLEELIRVLADNIANGDLTDTMDIWVNSINSNLDNSVDFAEKALARAKDNLGWDSLHINNVYNWIEENDAPNLAVSLTLLLAALVAVIYNQ